MAMSVSTPRCGERPLPAAERSLADSDQAQRAVIAGKRSVLLQAWIPRRNPWYAGSARSDSATASRTDSVGHVTKMPR